MADRTVIFLASGGVLQGVSSTADNVVCNGVVFNTDVTLERGAANRLDLLTGDSLNIVNGNLQFGGTTIIDAGGHGTFTTDSTDPGVNVGTVAGDPSSLANGDIWYNSTTNKFRGYENGAAADLISAGASSGWTDGGAEVYLTTSGDEVTVGASGGTLGKFTVIGDTAAQKQVVIKAAAAQSANLFEIQNSSGTAILYADSSAYLKTPPGAAGVSGYRIDIGPGSGGAASGGSPAGWGGHCYITAGNGGASGTGGVGATAGPGGNFTVTAGTGGTGNENPNAHPAEAGGNISLTSGTGGTGTATQVAGAGGSMTIYGGSGGTSGGGGGGNGGSVTIYSGNGTGNYTGGSLNIAAGSSLGSATGGNASFSAGTSNSGTGGFVQISGGSSSSGTGGALYLRAGSGTVSAGTVYIGDTATAQITVGAAAIHTRFVSGCQVTPSVDNTCSLGTNALRWNLIRGTTITSGDLQLENDDGSAAWTIREMPDHILAINRITGKKYRLAMEPVSE